MILHKVMVPPSSFAIGLLLCSLAIGLPMTRAAEFMSRYNSDSGPGHFPDMRSGKGGHHSSLVSDDDNYIEIYSNIIEMLGQLNVLTPHSRSCYVLHKIERIVNNSNGGGGGGGGDSNSSHVEVRLFFTESVLPGSVTAKDGDTTRDGNSGGTGSEANDDTDNADDEIANRTRAECKKKQAMAIWAGALTSGENAVNGSGSISAPSTKIEDYSRLSHTQLVVIVTCSSIIGLFFLVAGIMRIRNYVNRLQEEQAMAKRPTFRSCTVALRNSTGSSELLRRETLSSTSPSKGEDDRNSGGGDSIHSSPKQTGTANNQNFLTTSISPKQESKKKSSLQSPTSSIKYIDEDDTSKKESDTDEVEDEGESESKPLLASEVLSGKEDNKENGKGPVHFGNSLAFENFPNNTDIIPNAADTNEVNLSPNISSMENSYQSTGPPEPEISWLEQAVEESTIGSVTAGLTQSDSSISSGNKFYSYGTGQLEYVSPCQPNNGDVTSASSSSLGSPCSEKSPAITLQPSLGVDGELLPGKFADGPGKQHEVAPQPDICDNQPKALSHQNQSATEVSNDPRRSSNVENARGQDPSSTRHDNSINTDNNCNNNLNSLPCNNVIVPTTTTTNPTTTTSSSTTPSSSEPQPTGSGGQTKAKSGQDDTERDVVLVDVEGNYTNPMQNAKVDTVPLVNANLEKLPMQKETSGDENRREHPPPISTTPSTITSTSPHHSTSSNTSSPRAIPNVIASLPPMASRDTEYL